MKTLLLLGSWFLALASYSQPIIGQPRPCILNKFASCSIEENSPANLILNCDGLRSVYNFDANNNCTKWAAEYSIKGMGEFLAALHALGYKESGTQLTTPLLQGRTIQTFAATYLTGPTFTFIAIPTSLDGTDSNRYSVVQLLNK